MVELHRFLLGQQLENRFIVANVYLNIDQKADHKVRIQMKVLRSRLGLDDEWAGKAQLRSLLQPKGLVYRSNVYFATNEGVAIPSPF